MPQHNFPSEKGDLFIEYSVHFPTSLTDSQKQGLIWIKKKKKFFLLIPFFQKKNRYFQNFLKID